jgi:hypothetical protein
MNVMRRVWIVAVLTVAAAAVSLGAAELPAGILDWSDRPLRWSDFCATPPAGIEQSNWIASPKLVISWSATFTATRKGTTWTSTVTSLTVMNYVDPASSWAVSSRTSAAALYHEQLHFNLHEVYRRLLESALRPMSCQASTDSASLQTLNGLLNSTSAAILERAESAQLAFDSETVHGRNLQAQAVWETRIADLLVHPAAAP